MGLLYMFNTLPDNVTVQLNGGKTLFPIYKNTGDHGSKPYFVPLFNNQITIGSPSSDKQIYTGYNFFSVSVYGSTNNPQFNLNVPSISDVGSDLVLFIFLNKIILCDTSGITLATAESSV